MEAKEHVVDHASLLVPVHALKYADYYLRCRIRLLLIYPKNNTASIHHKMFAILTNALKRKKKASELAGQCCVSTNQAITDDSKNQGFVENALDAWIVNDYS